MNSEISDDYSADPFVEIRKYVSDDEIVAKIGKYIDIIVDYNSKVRLVGQRTRERIIDELVIPSLISTQLLYNDKFHLLDIGTGSGILGLVIKLVRHDVHMILCDNNINKISFLNDVIIKLDCRDVLIIHKTLKNIPINCLQHVNQLLIRGIKLVNIYDDIMRMFPRGTHILYFGSEQDAKLPGLSVDRRVDMPGNEGRSKPLHIYQLTLVR